MENEKFFEEFNNGLHRIGRVAMVLMVALLVTVPFLFGALGLKYFSKSLKLSLPPLILMSVLCILIPSLITQTSTMMIPVGALALALGFLLWKKDML